MTASGWASPASVLGVVFTFTPLAAICVGLRLWTRISIVRSPGWDDLCIVIAICFTLVDASCQVVKVHYGLGKHASELTPYQTYHIERAFWVATWNYYLGLGFAKLSIVLQCLRIFGRSPRFCIAAYTLGSIIAVFTLWTAFQSIFICWPIPHFWDREVPGKCLPRLALWFFNAAFSIVTDTATVILPMPIVNKLQMRTKERRVVQAVLALGVVICTVSCVRFYGLYAIAVSNDPAHDNPQVAILSNLEASVGIIAACVPTLKGLVTRYSPKICTTRGDSSTDPASVELSAGKSQASYTVLIERGNANRLSRLAGRSVPRACVAETDDSQWDTPRQLSDVSMQDHGEENEIRVVTTVEQSERDRGLE
ncbi:Hypothetical predicted protein [Lecanosticta acicola]|uniref:Rhodopsin domain-containing protein n=1 Tax=Lecanosticta acicola TaxID=111012 RepID=A0AAI9EB67_9PEZI|nr:Hypothetical predicted protein [Lecanosticta acicola]